MRIKSELEIYLEGLKTPELKAIYNAIPKRQQRPSASASLSSRIGLIASIRHSVKEELISNLPSQAEIEKSKLELAAKKAAKPKKPSTPKIPDSICTWRAGHYGAKCTINKTPLRVNFSDSGRSDAT
ncbi:MAG TPA: hypothetical protein V6C58_01630, partial [Allocoleopsis sp.]